jgi:ssDNA-binding Zn-finger/Zn-ribbon topoisomerase 1
VNKYKEQLKNIPSRSTAQSYKTSDTGKPAVSTGTKSGTKPAIPKSAKKCPKCKDGKLLERKGSKGVFYGCSNYPDCKHTENK